MAIMGTFVYTLQYFVNSICLFCQTIFYKSEQQNIFSLEVSVNIRIFIFEHHLSQELLLIFRIFFYFFFNLDRTFFFCGKQILVILVNKLHQPITAFSKLGSKMLVSVKNKALSCKHSFYFFH